MRECKQCRSCYDDSLEICPDDGEQLHHSLPISTIIDDTYQLTKLLASGSMGSVYRAEQQGLQRPVAIKILNPKLLTSNVARERFRREALAAASIKHPNIIAVYDFATTGNGLCYIVMELLEGQTLAQRLKVETKIAVNEAVKITLEVCEALAQAHSRGMIHRDLKPSNIFLSQIGNDTVTKIIDFGLVKLKERTTKNITSGALIGSLHYTAPEQFRSIEIDARADIYALGTILYHMLTGRPPFDTPNKTQLIYQQLNAKALPPHHIVFDISPLIEAAVMKALEKDPQARFQSISDFAAALKQAPKRNLRRTVGMFVSLPLDKKSSPTPETEIQQATQQTLSFDHFVARKRERAKLRQAYEQASEGKAIALLIAGDAGIGKSQLLSQSLKEFQETGTLCFFGQFTSNVTPLWSLLNIKPYLQNLLSDTNKFQEIFGSIAANIQEEILEISPKMPTAALFQPKVENRSEKSSELLAQVFLQLSQKQPIVIALDDLHLADEANLNFLIYLTSVATYSQILFLFTARSQDLARPENMVANWLDRMSNQRQLQRLALGPLAASDVRQLIEKIFSPIVISDEAITKLVTATEGNPFYLTNLLRLMLSENQISWDGQQWITNSLMTIKVPETVARLIEARLSFLPVEKRQVLEKASILGETFGFEVLRKFVGLDEDTLLKILDDCLRYGLIKETRIPEGGSTEDDYYSFTQYVLYQVLYEKWSDVERKNQHKIAAEILSELSQEQSLNAFAAKQFELAEDLELAFCHRSIAANRAWRAGEVNLAKQQLKKAQELTEKLPQLENLLDSATNLTEGNNILASNYCDYLILSVDLKICSTIEQAEEWMEFAVRLSQKLGEAILLARVLVAAGHFQQSRNDYIAALNYFERALMLYQQTGNKSRYNIILEQINTLRAKTKPQKPTEDVF